MRHIDNRSPFATLGYFVCSHAGRKHRVVGIRAGSLLKALGSAELRRIRRRSASGQNMRGSAWRTAERGGSEVVSAEAGFCPDLTSATVSVFYHGGRRYDVRRENRSSSARLVF